MNLNQCKQAPLKANHGFTLIEVLIAIAIFSVGILAVASLQLVNTRNNTTANIMTQATMLARAQMEQLENSDIATLASGGDPGQIDENGDPGGIFTRTWTIGPGAGPASREIEVTVNWNRRGQNRSVVLTTITRGN